MNARVRSRRVDDLFAEKRPGDFKFWRYAGAPLEGGPPDGLNFVCPCGCGEVLGVGFKPGSWTFDGNLDAPTVTPSIQHLDGCRWHGFLTAGEFKTC
jgi:hypothetical protein